MIKVILWDLDGTLTDFTTIESMSIKACFEKFNLGNCTDEMVAVYSDINKKYWEALEKGKVTRSELLFKRFEDFFSIYGLDTSKIPDFKSAYEKLLGETVIFMPHAYETVKALNGKVIQCLVTNGNKNVQEVKVQKSGLGEFFEHVFISEEIGCEIPAKEFFDKVFEVIGPVNKKEVLIIGDSLSSDISGGNNAGILTCRYNPFHLKNDKGVHIDIEIDDLNQVLTLVE